MTGSTQSKALQPVGSVGNLKTMFESRRDDIQRVLPQHMTADRLLKTLLTAVNKTPQLAQCTQYSVIEAVSRGAELGLDLSGTLGEAYLLPFNTKVDGQRVMMAQLIIGYQGFAKLARNSGVVKQIQADIVTEEEIDTERFVFDRFAQPPIMHKPSLKGRTDETMAGAYAAAYIEGEGWQAEFLPLNEIEHIRKQYSKSGNDKSGKPAGAWASSYGEMAKKTAFRRLQKWLPRSAELLNRAMEIDQQDFSPRKSIESTTPGGGGGAAASEVENLADQLTGEDGSNATIPQDDSEPEPQPESGSGGAAKPSTDGADGGDQDTQSSDPISALIRQLAEQKSVDEDRAERSLVQFVGKMYQVGSFDELSEKQIRDLKHHVEGGNVNLARKAS